MLLPAVILSLSVSQAGGLARSVAVISAGEKTATPVVERQVRAALAGAGLLLAPPSAVAGQDAAQCETNRLCYALAGRVLGTWAVVRVEAALLGGDIAVLIEGLQSEAGSVIAQTSFVVPAAALEAELPRRLPELAAALAAARPPPKAPALTPNATALPQGNPALELAPPRSTTPIWISAAGSVVFAGAAAGILAVSASARSCLHGPVVDGYPTVCVPSSQAAGVQQRADATLVGGVAAGAIALGLATTALIQYLAN